jgi:predicted nucleic acid-binding protein
MVRSAAIRSSLASWRVAICDAAANSLSLLANLPPIAVVSNERAMRFIEAHRLMGEGLGWTDVHLLAAAAVERAQLWSMDRRLLAAASRLGVGV